MVCPLFSPPIFPEATGRAVLRAWQRNRHGVGDGAGFGHPIDGAVGGVLRRRWRFVVLSGLRFGGRCCVHFLGFWTWLLGTWLLGLGFSFGLASDLGGGFPCDWGDELACFAAGADSTPRSGGSHPACPPPDLPRSGADGEVGYGWHRRRRGDRPPLPHPQRLFRSGDSRHRL